MRICNHAVLFLFILGESTGNLFLSCYMAPESVSKGLPSLLRTTSVVSGRSLPCSRRTSLRCYWRTTWRSTACRATHACRAPPAPSRIAGSARPATTAHTSTTSERPRVSGATPDRTPRRGGRIRARLASAPPGLSDGAHALKYMRPNTCAQIHAPFQDLRSLIITLSLSFHSEALSGASRRV